GGFLCLLLNAGGIHTIKFVVVVITSSTAEPDTALIASAVIYGAGSQQKQVGPVTTIRWKVLNLLRSHDTGQLGRTSLQQGGCSVHFDGSGNLTQLHLSIQGYDLPYPELHALVSKRLEADMGKSNRVIAYRHSGKKIDPFVVRQGLPRLSSS